MTEGWAIALLGGALAVMTAVLGWVATELRLIHKTLHGFVDKADCRADMGAHCKRLDDLEKTVTENSAFVAAVKQYHEMIGVPIVKSK